jgi:hypothetical protein
VQEEGLQSFLGYLRDLISKRAEEDYSALVEGGGEQPLIVSALLQYFISSCSCMPAILRILRSGSDYVEKLTNVFKDIAVALEENEAFVESTFGKEAVVEAVTSLQQVQAYTHKPLLDGTQSFSDPNYGILGLSA